MRLNFRFLIPALLLFVQIAGAQQTPDDFCGTRGMSKWFDWYSQNRDVLSADFGGDTSWLYVPMTIQLTANDLGSGYFNLEQAIIATDFMNQRFAPAKIRFYLMPGDPFRFLPNSYWHDHQWDGGADLIQKNRIPNRLNTFVVNDPAGNCGYSWMDAIVMKKSCSGAFNSTWSHEAGHHFSLPHPFFGWEGETWNYSMPAPAALGGYPVEKMDGSNCYNSGDRFCDTRPDYLNYRWGCDQNGESYVVQHDPNNVDFKSDATLIMGYASDACASRFSPEQIMAMRSNIMTEHSEYLQITDPLQEISDEDPVALISPIDTAFVQYNNVTFSWNPVPNASLYTIEVGLHENIQPKFIWETVYNATTFSITKSLPQNRLLYWRVRPYSEWDLSKQLAPQQVGVFSTIVSVATNELERVLGADLSPNPIAAGTPASLSLSSEKSMDVLITVADVTGRVLQVDAKSLHQGENIVYIETAALNAGVYLVSMQNEMGKVVKRLLVTE